MVLISLGGLKSGAEGGKKIMSSLHSEHRFDFQLKKAKKKVQKGLYVFLSDIKKKKFQDLIQ